jgi:hypothetical protein
MKPRSWTLWFLIQICGNGALALLGGCSPRPAVPLWNLPSVIGQPVDVAQKSLGNPQSESAATPGTMQSLWKRDDTTLSATWKSSNKRVLSYELISRDDDHALREGETAPLLVPGQLKENDPRYRIEWIEAANKPLFYTGVKVIPAPKNHAVTIRVSAGEALVQVAYQVSSAGGKSDDILTVAPWESTFTLPDDATVSLTAKLFKASGPTSVKVEIIADGKVVASNSSSGVVSCNYEL